MQMGRRVRLLPLTLLPLTVTSDASGLSWEYRGFINYQESRFRPPVPVLPLACSEEVFRPEKIPRLVSPLRAISLPRAACARVHGSRLVPAASPDRLTASGSLRDHQRAI